MSILNGRFECNGNYDHQMKINMEIKSLLQDPNAALIPKRAEVLEIDKAWSDYWTCKTQADIEELVGKWLMEREL
jgi:hypothetical protein